MQDRNQGQGKETTSFDGTASEAVRKSTAYSFFSSGSTGLDGLLGGGYRRGKVCHIFGGSRTGKTQLAIQAALLAAKSGSKTLYIDTEGAFRPERLEGMARKRGWDPQPLLESVEYVRCDTSSEQMEAVRRMPLRKKTIDCLLVVIDTLTRTFSLDMPGASNLAGRQGALNVHLSEIMRDAYVNGRAYLLTNRVTFGFAHDVGIGGKTVEQLVHRSIRLERVEAGISATSEPDGNRASLSVSEAGVD